MTDLLSQQHVYSEAENLNASHFHKQNTSK